MAAVKVYVHKTLPMPTFPVQGGQLDFGYSRVQCLDTISGQMKGLAAYASFGYFDGAYIETTSWYKGLPTYGSLAFTNAPPQAFTPSYNYVHSEWIDIKPYVGWTQGQVNLQIWKKSDAIYLSYSQMDVEPYKQLVLKIKWTSLQYDPVANVQYEAGLYVSNVYDLSPPPPISGYTYSGGYDNSSICPIGNSNWLLVQGTAQTRSSPLAMTYTQKLSKLDSNFNEIQILDQYSIGTTYYNSGPVYYGFLRNFYGLTMSSQSFRVELSGSTSITEMRYKLWDDNCNLVHSALNNYVGSGSLGGNLAGSMSFNFGDRVYHVDGLVGQPFNYLTDLYRPSGQIYSYGGFSLAGSTRWPPGTDTIFGTTIPGTVVGAGVFYAGGSGVRAVQIGRNKVITSILYSPTTNYGNATKVTTALISSSPMGWNVGALKKGL